MAYSSSGREKILFPQHRQLSVVLVQQYSDWTPFRATSSMLSPEQVVATSSVDLSMAHDDPNRPLHARPFLRKVVQTGALRASHSALVQRLPQLLASLVWTMRHSTVPNYQDQSRERVDCSVEVNPRRDREASQIYLPSARGRDRDLYQVRFRESKAQQSMMSMRPVKWFQRNVIWMSQSGILRCAWSSRDTIVKINARKGQRNFQIHGTESKTQYMKVVTYLAILHILNMPIDNPPEPLRPSSRASGSGLSQRSTTPTNLYLPTPLTEVNEHPENRSRNASGSRPRGPRSPSPLPPSPIASPDPDFESLNSALETTLHNLNRPLATPPKSVSPLPRSRRQPFEPTGNTEAAPRIFPHGVQKTPGTIEPLSIKKKHSLRNSNGDSSPSRKAQHRTPPNIRGRIVSPRRVSPIVRQKKATASSGSQEDVDLPKLLTLVESIKDEVGSPSKSFLRH
jgi:hypothetical protein